MKDGQFKIWPKASAGIIFDAFLHIRYRVKELPYIFWWYVDPYCLEYESERFALFYKLPQNAGH